jgi:hypothetical protein
MGQQGIVRPSEEARTVKNDSNLALTFQSHDSNLALTFQSQYTTAAEILASQMQLKLL